MVKANGDVDPLGAVSVLPLDTHRQHPAVQQVRRQRVLATRLRVLRAEQLGAPGSQILAFARRKCSDPSTQALFDQVSAAASRALSRARPLRKPNADMRVPASWAYPERAHAEHASRGSFLLFCLVSAMRDADLGCRSLRLR